MNWTLHRWTWVLEGPLFVGLAPAGSLNRCRLYVPARAVWGAVTAEAARRAASQFPDYGPVGQTLTDYARFSYLYPAERSRDRWCAWLPRYEATHGLCWRREAGRSEPVPDRIFRRRLLTTRPGTAIDPGSDSAADGSLRETECVCDRWRSGPTGEDDRVALVGYVFTQEGEARGHIESVDHLFLGGDTRYGLGRVRREAVEEAEIMFGARVKLDSGSPVVTTERVLAHAMPDPTRDENAKMRCALELLGGWDHGVLRALNERSFFWQPGSRGDGAVNWTIEPEGTWSATEARA